LATSLAKPPDFPAFFRPPPPGESADITANDFERRCIFQKY
jgi:hypothetical protein